MLALILTGMPSISAEAPTISVSSRAAVLYEPTSGRTLFEKEAHTALPMASTTKLMTALLAAEHTSWEQTVTVTEQAVRVEGSSLGLRAGDTLTVRDLVTGLLLESGNDAANVVALSICGSLEEFAVLMNEKAAQLGMTDSRFVTPSGLDAEGHGASAYDMALLAAEVLKNPVLAEICAMKTASIRINGVRITVNNHNRLLKTYPDAIGMKTGYTDAAGKCLVSAARRDGVVLIAVTLNGGDYWNDHTALYESGFARVKAVELPVPAPFSAAVAGGTATRTSLSIRPITAVLLDDEAANVRTIVRAPSILWAPVEADTVVGQVEYRVDGRLLGSAEIRTAEAVEARPPWSFQKRTWRLFRELWKELLVGYTPFT